MACHGGKGAVLQIFLLNAGIFTGFDFTSFPIWWTEKLYMIQTCKYSLPISNPNILY